MSDSFNAQKLDKYDITWKKRAKAAKQAQEDRRADRKGAPAKVKDYPVPAFVDGSDALGNKGFHVSFQHVPSGNEIKFKAFMTAFNETFASDWAKETVYGRADPIMLFKSTTRRISMAFKIPASSLSEAYENLHKVGRLAQFLYPNYLNLGNANTIAQGPLVRIQLANLLRRNDNLMSATQEDPFLSLPGGNAPSLKDLKEQGYSAVGSPGAPDIGVPFETAGLLGAITNITINHNLDTDAGVLEVGPSGVVPGKGSGNAILPKLIEVNLDFSPIHEHSLGWRTVGPDTYFSFDGFPYGTNITKTSTEAAAAAEKARLDKISAEAQLKQAMADDNESRFQGAKARWAKAKQWFGDIGSKTRENKSKAEEAVSTPASVDSTTTSHSSLSSAGAGDGSENMFEDMWNDAIGGAEDAWNSSDLIFTDDIGLGTPSTSYSGPGVADYGAPHGAGTMATIDPPPLSGVTVEDVFGEGY